MVLIHPICFGKKFTNSRQIGSFFHRSFDWRRETTLHQILSERDLTVVKEKKLDRVWWNIVWYQWLSRDECVRNDFFPSDWEELTQTRRDSLTIELELMTAECFHHGPPTWRYLPFVGCTSSPHSIHEVVFSLRQKSITVDMSPSCTERSWLMIMSSLSPWSTRGKTKKHIDSSDTTYPFTISYRCQHRRLFCYLLFDQSSDSRPFYDRSLLLIQILDSRPFFSTF